jgi:glycerol-3-phosphate dehydrogenase subunit C
VHGQFAGIPIVVRPGQQGQRHTKPCAADGQPARRAPRRLDARLAPQRFRWGKAAQQPGLHRCQRPAHAGQGGDLATCYVNYNEPGIGNDLIKLLDHNQIPYEIVEKEQCCGMPKLELGDLTRWSAPRTPTSRCWRSYAREGWAIVTPVPSCTLMFKQELPLMFPDEADVQLVKDAMFDPFEYLVARHKDGLLKTDFKPRWARSATTSPATAGCRTSARRPRRCSS